MNSVSDVGDARVGVVGASSRAAVHSLARAGLHAWAIDLFADRDLGRVAPCLTCPVESYPQDLVTLATRFPSGPFLFTGGLENALGVLRELSLDRELWGCSLEAIKGVRDPHQLFPTLQHAGFATPALLAVDEPCPLSGRWLRKPLHSAGGIGIRVAMAGEGASPLHYFQEWMEGSAMSAIYSGARLFGINQQLIGESWHHANAFGYCGAIGPVNVPLRTHAVLIRLGECLANEMGMKGAWGLDFILRDEQPYPIEVNPRYTASMEVLEHATGVGVFAGVSGAELETVNVVGKAIYFAPQRFCFPNDGPWNDDLAGTFNPWRCPAFADIPTPATQFETGDPVITLLVTASSITECHNRLQSRAEELNRLFSGTTS